MIDWDNYQDYVNEVVQYIENKPALKMLAAREDWAALFDQLYRHYPGSTDKCASAIKNFGFMYFFFLDVDNFNILVLESIIPRYAFQGCPRLISIEIPNTIRKIEGGAFSLCHNLKKVVISDNVTFISEAAFKRCYKLEDIKLPEKLQLLLDNMFEKCENLTQISLPDNITLIGEYVFKDCTNLQRIKMPNNLKGIINYNFLGCDSLKSIDLPKSIMPRCISKNAFKDSAIKEINYAGTAFEWDALYLPDFPGITINCADGVQIIYKGREIDD